jgi:hypothetical protein
MQVIIFDPQYDAYIPLCIANGGVPKAVKLNTEDWSVPHAGRRSIMTSPLPFYALAMMELLFRREAGETELTCY